MFAHAHRAVFALGCLCLGALAGCAQPERSHIPEFARPQLITGEEGELTQDLIGYRKLERGDFRAPRPPNVVGQNAEQMGAVTCATIKSRPGGQVLMTRRGDAIEVGAVGLEFEALMDRGCSWWNEARQDYSDAYVLEHEQVHLALFEIEARRLTRRAAELKVAGAAGDDPDALAERLQQLVDVEVDAAATSVLERSLRFDEVTSFQENQRAQREWLDTVERELRRLPR